MSRIGKASKGVAVLLCACVLTGCMEKAYEITSHSRPLLIGTDTVSVVTYEAERPGLTYLSLHDNENTCVEAVWEVMRRHGGRLVELQHSGERNISFTLDGTVYTFDPNRIFTDSGAVTTLSDLGPFSEAAHRLVRGFADQILEQVPIPGPDVVVTVHNNTQGEYSTLSYTDDGEYVLDALFVHVARKQDSDNFFFVTDQALYDSIRRDGYNAVLQNNATVLDDGSLSVYVGALGIPYVNVEAQHGHVEQQVEMLEYLNALLLSREAV